MNDTRLLDRGIYDVVEVARLVRRTPDEVARWGVAAGPGDALLLPREERLLSFYDLVTAAVVARFREQRVPLAKIRSARRYLADRSGVPWPLAHAASLNRLANVGSDLYHLADDADREDASRGGQGAFQAVVVPMLHRLEFDAEDMASLWRPVGGVVIDPRVQAGAPCVEGTRVATELIAGLADAGESPEDIASDYDLDLDVVNAALAYEHGLAAA